MDIVILSDEGKSLDLAVKMRAAGHSVALWVKNKNFDTVGGGMVNVLPVWEPTNADLYLLDSPNLSELEFKLTARGSKFLAISEAGRLMQEPFARWQRLASASVPMPPTTVAYLSEINQPPEGQSLVHFVKPFAEPRLVSKADWPKLKQSFPADQEIAVVVAPEGPRAEALGLVHHGKLVEGSCVIITSRTGWSFSLPAPWHVQELLRLLAPKMPHTYSGPLALQLIFTELGWITLEFLIGWPWELLPHLMRSIKEDAKFVLDRLAAKEEFAVTSNGRMTFLQQIVASETFEASKRGAILPNLAKGMPAVYHPMNVYREEGFYKFAGTSRYLGAWTFSGFAVDEIIEATKLPEPQRHRITTVISERMQLLTQKVA